MKKSFVLAAVLAAAPFAATAGELSYTYVEGGYAKVHIDEELLDNPEGDGGYIRGSAAISPSFYLFGGAGRVSNDFNLVDTKIDVDLTHTEAGIGYHQAMGERVEFLAELAYLRQELEVSAPGFGSANDDAKGGRASIGLRGQIAEPLEGWIKVGYLDGGDFDSAFAGTLGGQYKFNQTWGLVGEVEIIEETTRYTVGVRASF